MFLLLIYLFRGNESIESSAFLIFLLSAQVPSGALEDEEKHGEYGPALLFVCVWAL